MAGQRAGLLGRLRHPKTTVRWRLTLLYGGLFLISGVALLAITYTLVAHATVNGGPLSRESFVRVAPGKQAQVPPAFQRARTPNGGPISLPVRKRINEFLGSQPGRIVVQVAGSSQRISDLHQLVIESAIALAIMALISTALGWVVAGHVLAPLRTMTATAQEISAANLHERIDMQGPRDELKQLADTIDGLLGRLEGAFDAQRRFVANASHELRTPLTAARAMLEMVLLDPHATVQTFRTTCRHVLEESEQQEQLIDALLALAQGQRGIDRLEALDLAVIAKAELSSHELDATASDVRLVASLEPALISGDRRLISRLVSNLLENALRHNTTPGRALVEVKTVTGEASLRVTNTGPPVPAEEIERLLQPFQRMSANRVGQGDGLGLGLSIVAAIANAHRAALEVRPGAQGGLDIEIRFPRVPYDQRVDTLDAPQRRRAERVPDWLDELDRTSPTSGRVLSDSGH
jgi:signal transduction histidine kinase